MKTTKVYIMICALCTATIAGNLLSAVVAAAQDPMVVIKQSVQNQTTNSPLSEADTKEQALQAKPGDVIKYVITIKNNAAEAENNKNDFAFTKLIDALPAGVELVSNGATREINEDLGNIQPGKTVTKEYIVKVTGRDGDVLENKACFTGRFEAENKAQSDCEPAFVAIAEQPKEPSTPTPTTPATETPKTEEQTPSASQDEGKTSAPATSAEALPTTGPSDFIAPLAALGAGGIAYTGRLLSLKRRG